MTRVNKRKLKDNTFKQLCIDLEHYETDLWPVHRILQTERMDKCVFDPCAGIGIMAEAAKEYGHNVKAFDIHDWGYPLDKRIDFLSTEKKDIFKREFTVFMNPPFSKAVDFVLHAKKLGANKIICFQRFAWWESNDRKEFWDNNPPSKVIICGARATCWRHDIPKSKRKSSASTAHAFFVFEGKPMKTILERIYKTKNSR